MSLYTDAEAQTTFIAFCIGNFFCFSIIYVARYKSANTGETITEEIMFHRVQCNETGTRNVNKKGLPHGIINQPPPLTPPPEIKMTRRKIEPDRLLSIQLQ